MLHLAYYVSGHGFGHAVRSAQVMLRLLARCPAMHIHVRTTAPPVIFGPPNDRLSVQSVDVDSGAAELNPLDIDIPGTQRRVRDLLARRESVVSSEAHYLHQHGVKAIVGDVPYLAGYIAAAAGLPCVLVGNFTWDWIYEPFFANSKAHDLSEFVTQGYARVQTLLRLPFSHRVSSIAEVIDVPLIARQPQRSRHAIRRQLALEDEKRPLILSGTRGGLPDGVLERVAADTRDLMILAIDQPSPTQLENVRHITLGTQLTFPELLCACDAVVSKLGYGIVSEAIANGTRLLWPARTNFREDEILGSAIQHWLPAREIPRSDFTAGHWRYHLESLLQLPIAAEVPDTSGADACALHVLKIADGR
jgi:L-arabinokinase